MPQREAAEGGDVRPAADPAHAWAQAQKAYAEIQEAQARAQGEAYARAQQLSEEATRTYFAGASNLTEEVKGQYREAWLACAARAQEAIESQDASKLTEAKRAFDQAMVGLTKQMGERVEKLQEDLRSAMERSVNEYRSQARDAYRSSLQAQRQFWSNLDIDSLVPRQ